MRKAFSILFLVVFTAALAFADDGPEAETHDDHDDKAAVQAGYVVITPSGPSAGAPSGTAGTVTPSATANTGLVAFETFGLRWSEDGGASQAGILPSGLTTSAVLLVERSGRLSRNLGVALVNPNNSNVNVTVTLRKSDGTQVATGSVAVPSHQQVSKFVTEFFSSTAVPTDFTGTLTVRSEDSSPLPIAVIGLRFRGRNFSTLPVTNLGSVTTSLPQIATGVGGDGAILLPQFAAGGGWATEIVLGNTGPNSLKVRVDLFKSDGTPLKAALNGQSASSFTDLTIPAGGVLILAPRDRYGDDDF
jgi:hypothetical protein